MWYSICIPSVDKGTHASKRDNFGIFCVIIIRCTGRMRSENNAAGRKIYSVLTVYSLVN